VDLRVRKAITGHPNLPPGHIPFRDAAAELPVSLPIVYDLYYAGLLRRPAGQPVTKRGKAVEAASVAEVKEAIGRLGLDSPRARAKGGFVELLKPEMAKLEAERAGATANGRQPPPACASPAPTGHKLSKIDLAKLIKQNNPEWGIRQVARAVPCSHVHLVNSEDYRVHAGRVERAYHGSPHTGTEYRGPDMDAYSQN
jgi:hypothetical protein